MTGNKRLNETKNTTSMEARKYPNKVSPAFYIQVQQGLLMTELEVADLSILVDGRWLDVVTVEPNKEHQQLIIDTSHDMWLRVLKARAIKMEYEIPNYFGVNPEFLTERQKEGAMLLSELEPDLTGTDKEIDFIKEMVKVPDEEVEMQGTPEQLEIAKRYIEVNAKIKALNQAKNIAQEELVLSLGGFNKASFDDIEDKPFFTYKKDARGSKRLYVPEKLIRQSDI
jgi:hypothetical protein